MGSISDPNITTLTVREVNALAGRLYSRGISKLATDPPEQARDPPHCRPASEHPRCSYGVRAATGADIAARSSDAK
jgi:hypothetical protein